MQQAFRNSNRLAKTIGWALGLCLAVLSVPFCQAGNLPALDGEADRAECRIALAKAEVAFRSASPTLQWPVPGPSDPATRIVLSRKAEDISGGDGIRADPAVFDRILLPGVRDILFWQRQERDGVRLAVVDHPVSWHGDWYRTISLSALISPEGLAQMDRNDGWMSDAAVRLVLGDNRWSPPVVLEDRQTKNLWLIDPGEVFGIMADWTVLVPGPEGMTPVCTIRFVPGDAVIGLEALPRAVRRFAALADEALGPGLDEGTTQPTARIRFELRKTWALATERPWALTGQLRNTRAEVDAGLRAWAKGVPARERLLAAVPDRQAEAEHALALSYRSRFGLSSRQSRVVAEFVLDYLFRSHFRFHADDRTDSPASDNAWSDSVREPKGAGQGGWTVSRQTLDRKPHARMTAPEESV